MKRNYTLHSKAETQSLAEAIGRNLRGGECIEFISDLGGGKTTFITYLVAASGSRDPVSSPTFTISKQYKTAENTIYHFDFYRLSEPGHAAAELTEAIGDKNSIILIEWADSIRGVLPENRMIVRLDKHPTEADGRICSIESPEDLEYLLERVS